jgi:hypothetical protein
MRANEYGHVGGMRWADKVPLAGLGLGAALALFAAAGMAFFLGFGDGA